MTHPVTWPEKARCAIMMTFDLDGESPWIHRDPALAERPLHMSMGAVPPVGNGIWSQEDVWEIWSEEFEGMYVEGGFFNWLGHPQVVGRPSRIRMVERLIQTILGKKDVWWPKPGELARFWLEQSQSRTAR